MFLRWLLNFSRWLWVVLGDSRSFLPLVTTFDIRKQFEIKSCPTAISFSCWIN